MYRIILWKQECILCTCAPVCFADEDMLLLTDLKAAETEKEGKKEKEAKVEETVAIKLKEEKPKEEAKPLEKKPQKPKGIIANDESTKYYIYIK